MRERKCCPIWVVLTIVLALAAFAAAAFFIVKKLRMIGGNFQSMDEGYWPEDSTQKTEDTGVPYTTDRDFV